MSNLDVTRMPRRAHGVASRVAGLSLLVFSLSASIAEARSVRKFYARVRGVGVSGIIVDLNNPKVKVSVTLAGGFPNGSERFASLARKSGCTAAITGTFFGVKNKHPIGHIVIDGKTRYYGRRGTALIIDSKNQVRFQRVREGPVVRWGDYETVLVSGPKLVHNGFVQLSPKHEGFSDRGGLFRKAARCAVGYRSDRRLLLVAVRTRISLWQLARVMRALGCVEAMNLDGGTSSGLYFAGAVLISPGRNLVNVLTVSENVPLESRYQPIKATITEVARLEETQEGVVHSTGSF